MAEEIALDIKIQTAESASTVKELKNSLKDLKNELNNVEAGSAGFKKLSKSINETEGKLGDLNDSFKTLTGSGVERANTSLGLLKEGFGTFDFGKIKAGLSGVGAAFKAIPIFLVVEGVRYLVENFKELSEGSGLLAKALQVVGKVIDLLKEGFNFITDAIGLTNTALDAMGEKIKGVSDKTKESLDEQIKAYDQQIAKAKASGQSTVELEIAKQKAIQATNDAIIRQAIEFVKAGGTMTSEQEKIVKAAIASNKDAANQIEIIQINSQNAQRDEYKKHLEKKAQDDKDYQDAYKKSTEAQWAAEIKAAEDAEKAKTDAIKAEKDYLNAYLKNEKDAEWESSMDNPDNPHSPLNQANIDAQYANKKAEEEAEKRKEEQKQDIYRKSFEAARGLSDLYFAHQLKNAKGNAAAELEIKKKQFKVNKAFQITMAVIDGIRSVQAALATSPPLSYVLAGLNGVLAAISIAKIASTKFEGGDVSASAGDVGSVGATASAPPIPQPNNTVTKISDDGKIEGDKKLTQQPIKAVVVETDITAKQKRVNTIEETAKLG